MATHLLDNVNAPDASVTWALNSLDHWFFYPETGNAENASPPYPPDVETNASEDQLQDNSEASLSNKDEYNDLLQLDRLMGDAPPVERYQDAHPSEVEKCLDTGTFDLQGGPSEPLPTHLVNLDDGLQGVTTSALDPPNSDAEKSESGPLSLSTHPTESDTSGKASSDKSTESGSESPSFKDLVSPTVQGGSILNITTRNQARTSLDADFLPGQVYCPEPAPPLLPVFPTNSVPYMMDPWAAMRHGIACGLSDVKWKE
ncbi:hypothetical protein BSKO_06329 [Bryopsis sp. KO-2023]|nr:hypothetical protein BSKO_06329 [Bryopsis sp. KO-2023]